MAKGNNSDKGKHSSRRKRELEDEQGSQPPVSDGEDIEESEEEEEEFDMKNYRKFLARMFPSKHTELRAAASTSESDAPQKKQSPKKRRKLSLK